jgi:uncharacterized protein with PQ loop repeat
MEHKLLVNIIGVLLVITSILDALKYEVQARKIIQAKSSKNMSRRFINWALLNDLVKLVYGSIICDFYIIFTSVLSLITMCHMWYAQYKFYPFKHRGLLNFKRPNIFIYLINSILPNRLRKRL